MTKEEAKKIVDEYLITIPRIIKVELCIVEEETIDIGIAWVFFFESAAFVKEGERKELLAGNAPIFISKMNSEIKQFGTDHPVEYYIAKYIDESKAVK